jgi:hypothetical protein
MPDDTPTHEEPTLPNGQPTEEELQTLPYWAVVALAVRCAQRVKPLFDHAWPGAPRVRVDELDRAITVAQVAAVNPSNASSIESKGARGAAAAAARAAARTAPNSVSRAAANAAAYAADAANSDFVRRAYAAYSAAYSAAADTAADAAAAIRVAIQHDYDVLRSIAERERWTNDVGIDTTMLGPLWPAGEPDGWPVRQQNPYLSPTYLYTLPPLSRIALALRCAQRVRPIIAACETPSLHEYLPIIDEELSAIETGLRTGDLVPYLAGKRAIADLEEASDEVEKTSIEGDMAAAHRAVNAVRCAIEAAQSIARQILIRPSNPFNDIPDVYDAFRLSGDAVAAFIADVAGSGNSKPADIAATADAQALTRAARDAGADGLKSIDPYGLGPLWPYGPPEGWPEGDTSSQPDSDGNHFNKEHRMVLKIPVLPMEDTPENRVALKEHLRAMIKAANLVLTDPAPPPRC